MELSTDWIKEFKLEDKDYKQFYKEKVSSIRVYLLYITKHQELFHIKKHRMTLENSILKKQQLVDLLKKHRNYQNKKYFPLSILTYNMTLDPQNIQEFIKNPEDYNYTNPETSIESIEWFDSIAFLQDVNSLYIVFREKWKTKSIGTKKIRIENLNRKKTRSKRLKDRSRNMTI